jgi:hypothetical protein
MTSRDGDGEGGRCMSPRITLPPRNGKVLLNVSKPHRHARLPHLRRLGFRSPACCYCVTLALHRLGAASLLAPRTQVSVVRPSGWGLRPFSCLRFCMSQKRSISHLFCWRNVLTVASSCDISRTIYPARCFGTLAQFGYPDCAAFFLHSLSVSTQKRRGVTLRTSSVESHKRTIARQPRIAA